MRPRLDSILRLLLLCVAMSQATANACQVPVFRWALERWEAQPFDVVVFHRGALSSEQMLATRTLAERSPTANLQVHDVDLNDSTEGEAQKIWKAQVDPQLPWAAVQYRAPDGEIHMLWSGPLDSPDLKQLADSPIRRAIRDKLLAGESAVWLLVDGGDRNQDDAAFELLRSRLKALEAAIQVPVPDLAGGRGAVLTDLPLKLSFPLLRISRIDPAERMFLRFLFSADKALLESKEPAVVPIFGRGRALVCMSGKSISSDSIDEAAMFLGGECSCEVKELSPGYDLLITADWNTFLRDHLALQPPVSTDLPSPTAQPPEPPIVAAATLTPVSVPPVTTVAGIDRSNRRALLLAGVGVAGILSLVLGWLTFRPKTDSKELR